MDTPNKLTEQAKKILEERCAAFEAGYATQQKMLGIQANRIAELEAQLEQRETFYKSEMQRERDNYNAAIKNANNIIAQLKEYERGAWNEAIEAAAQFCNNNAIAFDNGNSYLSPVDHELLEEMSGKNFKHGGTYYADAIRELKK